MQYEIIAPGEISEALDAWVETQEIITLEAGGVNEDGTYTIRACWPDQDQLLISEVLPALCREFKGVKFEVRAV